MVNQILIPKKGEEEGDIACAEENKIVVDLQKFILKFDPANLGLDEIHDDFNVPPSYLFPVDEIPGQTVVLRPIPYRDASDSVIKAFEIRQQYEEMDEEEVKHLLSPELMEKYSNIVDISTASGVDSLAANIYYIRTASGKDVSDPDAIREWILNVSTTIIERLRTHINGLVETIRKIPLLEYNCQKCGKKNETYLQLDPQLLFTSAEGSEEMPIERSASSTRQGKKKNARSKTLQR